MWYQRITPQNSTAEGAPQLNYEIQNYGIPDHRSWHNIQSRGQNSNQQEKLTRIKKKGSSDPLWLSRCWRGSLGFLPHLRGRCFFFPASVAHSVVFVAPVVVVAPVVGAAVGPLPLLSLFVVTHRQTLTCIRSAGSMADQRFAFLLLFSSSFFFVWINLSPFPLLRVTLGSFRSDTFSSCFFRS